MTQVTNKIDRELGWDDEITEDGIEFIILQPGDYNFTVKGFERQRFEGSAKMPACPMAVIDLAIIDPKTGREVIVKRNLFLHTKTEWTIGQFFTSIGLKRKGEPFRPNWNAIAGKTGRLKLNNSEYNGKTYNEVETFYEAPEETGQQTTYSFD